MPKTQVNLPCDPVIEGVRFDSQPDAKDSEHLKTLFDADVSKDADKVGNVLSRLVMPFASQATLKWIADNRLPTRTHRSFNRDVNEIDAIVNVINELTLIYNKSRQAAITKELSEIVGGAAAV